MGGGGRRGERTAPGPVSLRSDPKDPERRQGARLPSSGESSFWERCLGKLPPGGDPRGNCQLLWDAVVFSLFIRLKITQREDPARRVGERADVPSEGAGRSKWNLAAESGWRASERREPGA